MRDMVQPVTMEINRMSEGYTLRAPTVERASAKRQKLTPPPPLTGRTVALLGIGKERSDECLDSLEQMLPARGHTVRRYAKPSPFKQAAAAQCAALGFAPAIVWVPHPIQNRSAAELAPSADDALAPILAPLAAGPAPAALAQ